MSPNSLDDALQNLLVCSFEAWRIGGKVVREADGALLIATAETHLRISRAPAELPFRWMMADGERTRGAASVSGLLRHVREAVDPGYRPVRLRVAPLPLPLPT